MIVFMLLNVYYYVIRIISFRLVVLNKRRSEKMKISSIDIQNFRKLKNCSIDLSGTETVFVGANNSGKTTAMDAVRKFLKNDRPFVLNDLTLSNRKIINEIGEKWIDANYILEDNLYEINSLLPCLDVWLEVEDNEIHYVSHMIPTLDWNGGTLGVRFLKGPKDSQGIVLEYIESYNRSREVERNQSSNKKSGEVNLRLWPKNLSDFLEKKLNDVLGVKYYLLDPAKKKQLWIVKLLFKKQIMMQNF